MNELQLNFLTWILQSKRPHGSKGLDTFIDELFASYQYEIYRNPKGDPLAVVISVGIPSGKLVSSRTLFSCHLDTVHRSDGFQEVVLDGKTLSLSNEIEDKDDDLPVLSPATRGLIPISTYRPFKAGCLGADDGAGIWLMLEMIDAGVPGTYIFHYGEEKGGIGSMGMVTHHSDFLWQFDRAVAFDRRGTQSVITHQGYGRCCSDMFAEALCSALADAHPKIDLWPDNTGIFTDTANYTDLIGECTNISCGYDAEHTDDETLNVTFLSNLRDALIKVDWENLPTGRQPGEDDFPAYSYGSYAASANSYTLDDLDKLSCMKYRDLVDWVRQHKNDPEYIADVLYEALADRLPPAGTTEPFCEEDDWV